MQLRGIACKVQVVVLLFVDCVRLLHFLSAERSLLIFFGRRRPYFYVRGVNSLIRSIATTQWLVDGDGDSRYVVVLLHQSSMKRTKKSCEFGTVLTISVSALVCWVSLLEWLERSPVR